MKLIAIIILLSIQFSFCFAEIQIPDSIKNNIKNFNFDNDLDEKKISSIIRLLVDQNFIKNAPVTQQIHEIPEYSKIEFIKLSGRINEIGKTAMINLEITQPNGKLDIISTPLIETGSYSTVYPIYSYSQIGTYKVEVYFSGEKMSVYYFHLTKNKVPVSNFPSWLVTNFKWWKDGRISDSDLTYSIQHLMNLGLILIPEKQTTPFIEITGEKLVRRGTTHTINIHVTDDFIPISGAKVTLTIEDYGENIIREFDGFTDQNGFFIFSWEIPKKYNDYETLLAYVSVSGHGFSQTKLFKFQVYCLPGTVNCNIKGN